MAKRPSGPATPSPGGSSPSALLWVEGLLCGGLITLLPSLALLLAVLLGPAIAALIMDHHAGKPVARSVILCNLAAIIGPVRALWQAGQGMASAVALASDPNAVGTAWAAAAAGWLLAELAPFVTRAALEAYSLSHVTRLRTQRAALVEEWGLDPAVTPAEPAPVSVRATPAR